MQCIITKICKVMRRESERAYGRRNIIHLCAERWREIALRAVDRRENQTERDKEGE
jgi:hypothetical protein